MECQRKARSPSCAKKKKLIDSGKACRIVNLTDRLPLEMTTIQFRKHYINFKFLTGVKVKTVVDNFT